MTLIVAARGSEGPALIGGDSYLGEGSSGVHDIQGAPKIVRVCHGQAWIGLAGEPSTYGNAIWALEKLDLERFDLRRDLRHYMKEREVPVDVDISALLIHGREIWGLDESWAAHPIGRDFSAVGVGRDFAMGMLAYAHATGSLKRNPKSVLRRVMRTAEKMVDGVRSPFDFSDIVER